MKNNAAHHSSPDASGDSPQSTNDVIKDSSAEPAKAAQKSWLQKIQELATLLGGGTVLFVAIWTALIYILGRIHAISYYTSLNVPFSLISLSAWEYNEKGWTYLWIGLIITLVLLSYVLVGVFFYIGSFAILLPLNIFFDVIISFILSLLLLLPKRIKNILVGIIKWAATASSNVTGSISAWWRTWWAKRKEIYKHRYLKDAENFDKKVRQVLFPYYLVTFLLIGMGFLTILLQVMFTQAQQGGHKAAIAFASGEMLLVEVTSSEPIDTVSSPKVISDVLRVGEKILYTYEGVYLLDYNNGRYFLFDDLDTNCRPAHVYVIKDDVVNSIQYTSAPAIKPDCQKLLTPTPVHSPIPTTAPATPNPTATLTTTTTLSPTATP